MTKTFLLFITLISIYPFVYGQESSSKNDVIDYRILNAKTFNKGVYLSFKEFQDNEPSVVGEFKFGNKKGPFNYTPSDQVIKQILYISTDNQYIRYQQKHWGYCDGESLYIFYDKKYLKISIKGKYSIFVDARKGSGFNTQIVEDMDFLLDLTNGNTFRFNQSEFEKILLKEDSSLLKEYKQDKGRRYMSNIYLKRLNELFLYNKSFNP